MEYTTIYKVYGCNEEGKPILYAEFLDLKPACRYAVAQHGKIHYNLPEIEKQTYCYDPENQTVSVQAETIEPAQIYYMTKV
jgi:hypothetical protein